MRPARVGDLPLAQRPIGQVTHQRAPGECVLGDEVVDPCEIVVRGSHISSFAHRTRAALPFIV